MKIEDIEEIEVTYSCHMAIEIKDFSTQNLDLWQSGRVKRFWIKYCTIFMELDDGTIVEEYAYTETHEDLKWPIKTFVRHGDDWSEWEE